MNPARGGLSYPPMIATSPRPLMASLTTFLIVAAPVVDDYKAHRVPPLTFPAALSNAGSASVCLWLAILLESSFSLLDFFLCLLSLLLQFGPQYLRPSRLRSVLLLRQSFSTRFGFPCLLLCVMRSNLNSSITSLRDDVTFLVTEFNILYLIACVVSEITKPRAVETLVLGGEPKKRPPSIVNEMVPRQNQNDGIRDVAVLVRRAPFVAACIVPEAVCSKLFLAGIMFNATPLNYCL